MKRKVLATLATSACIIICTGYLSGDAHAQVQDQILLYESVTNPYSMQAGRFDRQLHWLGSTDFPAGSLTYAEDTVSIALDGQGRYWIPWDPLVQTQSLIISPFGVLLPNVVLGHNPMDAAAGRNGDVYFITRIPLSANGPIYAIKSDGTPRWMSWDAVSLINNGIPPTSMLVSAAGDVYIGGSSKGACGCKPSFPVVIKIDPSTGQQDAMITFPSAGFAQTVRELAASPDGGFWAYVSVPGGNRYYHVLGTTITNEFPALGGYNGGTGIPRIDGNGYIYGPSYYNYPISDGSEVLKFSPVDGSIVEAYPLGRIILCIALSPNGEELFTISGIYPGIRFLDRINLVTGVVSSLTLDPQFVGSALPGGDPTGYIYANIIDREGDADGDGVLNGEETAQRTNPYDPTSVPWGPRVYLYWTASNAIKLKYTDPDGLLSPTGGLVAADLQVEGFGDILPYLIPFVTSASLNAGATELEVEFGAWPVPPNLKLRFTARAQDATGAIGSDWAVSPPGEL